MPVKVQVIIKIIVSKNRLVSKRIMSQPPAKVEDSKKAPCFGTGVLRDNKNKHQYIFTLNHFI